MTLELFSNNTENLIIFQNGHGFQIYPCSVDFVFNFFYYYANYTTYFTSIAVDKRGKIANPKAEGKSLEIYQATLKKAQLNFTDWTFGNQS